MMTDTGIRRLFKQKDSGTWLGAFKHSIGQIGIYMSFMNMFILLTTLYSTEWIQNNVIDISYFQFMGIGAVVLLLLLAFSYLVDMRSYFGFWRKQVGLDKIEDDIAAIKKHLGIDE